MTEEDTPKKGLAILALFLALGAVAAILFVLGEPIPAYERLKSGTYNFGASMTESLMRGRMREASIPLIAGSVLGAISLALTLKRPGKLAKGGDGPVRGGAPRRALRLGQLRSADHQRNVVAARRVISSRHRAASAVFSSSCSESASASVQRRGVRPDARSWSGPQERVALGVAAVATVSALAAAGLGYRVGEGGGALVYEHGAASVYAGDAPANGPINSTRPQDEASGETSR